jgi:hypothetical protein
VPHCGHIGFSPFLPPRGKEALDFYYLAKTTVCRIRFDLRAGLHLYPRQLIHVSTCSFAIAIQRSNEYLDVRKLFVALVLRQGRKW